MSEENNDVTTEATISEESNEVRQKSAAEVMANDREECAKEIAATLQKYNCDLTATMEIGQSKIVPRVQIVNNVPK